MDNRKKVLFISHSAEWGGAEKCLYLLVKHLQKERFAPLVLVPSEGPLAEALRLLDIETRLAPLPWWMGGAADDVSTPEAFAEGLGDRVRSLKQMIIEEGIDLVFTNTITVIDGALAAAEAGVPHVYHILELLSHDPALTPILPLEYVYQTVNEFSDELVVVSDCVRQEIHRFCPEATVKVVTTGVEPLPVNCSEKEAVLGVSEDCPIVTFVGALSERKGVTTLAQCVAALRTRFPATQVLFVGPDLGQKKHVRRIARRAGVGNAIRCTGARRDIGDILAASDILVMPSLADPLPLTVMEAMAAGLPVVATRSGGCEEMVLDGVTGYLVAPKNDGEMAQAILRLLEDPAAARQMGKAGRRRQEEQYSVESYVRAFENLLEQRITSGVLHQSTGEYLNRRMALLKAAAQAHAVNARQRRELALLHDSLSYRIGRLITWPIRSTIKSAA